MDEAILRNIALRVKYEGENKEKNDSYNGRFTSSGSNFVREAEMFLYGLSHTLPPGWQKYVTQIEKESDPDYNQYLKLKNKFKE